MSAEAAELDQKQGEGGSPPSPALVRSVSEEASPERQAQIRIAAAEVSSGDDNIMFV